MNQTQEDYTYTAKGMIISYLVILVGQSSVGKTHFLKRFVSGELPRNSVPTIGVEFATKTLQVENGEKVKMQIWDTAGQERYRSITQAHYRRANGALLLYDITKERSFENLRNYIEEIRYLCEPDIVIMLVGNKSDLADTNPASRQIEQYHADQYAIQNNMFFTETSTVTKQNVEYCFQRLAEEIAKIKSTKVDSTYQ